MNTFSYGCREILSVIIFFNSCRKKINIASVDILSSSSGSFIDGGDDNIKYAGTDLLGFLAFSQQHSHIEDSPKVKKSELCSFARLIYDVSKL